MKPKHTKSALWTPALKKLSAINAAKTTAAQLLDATLHQILAA